MQSSCYQISFSVFPCSSTLISFKFPLNSLRAASTTSLSLSPYWSNMSTESYRKQYYLAIGNDRNNRRGVYEDMKKEFLKMASIMCWWVTTMCGAGFAQRDPIYWKIEAAQAGVTDNDKSRHIQWSDSYRKTLNIPRWSQRVGWESVIPDYSADEGVRGHYQTTQGKEPDGMGRGNEQYSQSCRENCKIWDDL